MIVLPSNPSSYLPRLGKDVDLCATRALEGRQSNTALSTLVLNVLETVDEVRNTRQAEEEAEAQSPKTKKKESQSVTISSQK
jgi:hypothetical protein